MGCLRHIKDIHAPCVNQYVDKSGYIDGLIVLLSSTSYSTDYQYCVIFYLYYRLLKLIGKGSDHGTASPQLETLLSTMSPART